MVKFALYTSTLDYKPVLELIMLANQGFTVFKRNKSLISNIQLASPLHLSNFAMKYLKYFSVFAIMCALVLLL